MRIVAVAGLVAALLMGAGSFVLGRADATVLEPEAEPAALASVLPLPAEPAAEPASKDAPVQKPARRKAEVVAVDPDGLPMSVSSALLGSRSVVVALYLPGGEVDELAMAEARAGAKDAGVAFVALDALGAQAGPLVEKLGGTMDAPAVLIFNRPGNVVFTLEGFADRNTVAQAAANALLARS